MTERSPDPLVHKGHDNQSTGKYKLDCSYYVN